MAFRLYLDLVSVWIIAQMLSCTSAFTISGNGTGTDGASVPQGENLRMTCSSSRNDIGSVRWYKNPRGNSDYQTSPSVSMKMGAGGSCQFDPTYPVPANMKCDCVNITQYTCTLISVQTDMKGDKWRCRFAYGPQASSGFAFTNDLTIDLTVGITSTNISSPNVNPVSVIVNTAGTFQCQTSPGNPKATVVWYKDNKTPATVDDTQITSGTSTTSTPDGDLFITHGNLTLQVQRDDQDMGVYCRASNGGQWFSSGTKRINVLYGPDRLECTANNLNISTSFRVIIGSTFSISCKADSKPLPNTYLLSGPGGTNLQLSFTGIARTQAGLYTVEARNSMSATGSDSPVTGQNSTNFTIDVLYTPSVPTIRLNGIAVQGKVNIIEGNSKVFNCSTDSNPGSNYSWTYPRGSRANSILQVNNFLPDADDGDFTCNAQNKLEPSFGSFQNGVNMTTITVDVLYPPRIPSFKYDTPDGPDISESTIAVVQGHGATVACVADSKPAPHIYSWSGSQPDGQLLSLRSFNRNTTVQCTAYNTMTETNGNPDTRSNVSSLQIVVWQTPHDVTLRYNYDKTGNMAVTDELKVLTGDSFWLSCSAVSSPPSTYTWTGQTSSSLAGIYNITGGLSTSKRVSCLAENFMQTTFNGTVHGTQSADLHIDALYGPKISSFGDVSVVRGKTLVYPCLYEPGNPPNVSFEWSRSGSIPNWTKQNTQNLTIPNVQRSDEANYTCNVSSVLRPTLTSATTTRYDIATFYLDVLYGAENLQFLLNNVSHTSVEIEEHSIHTLRCSLESDPASHVSIVKDGKTILERPGVHQLIHGIKAECSDTGVYTCSGYNQYGMADNASVRLFVKCSARQPPGVDVKLKYTARQHENVTLSYTIVAYPVPEPSQFVWKRCFNESEDSCHSVLDSMLKFDVITENLSSYLTIRDVRIKDYGMYQLSVSNGIGSPLVEWMHLKPIGKPELPTDFHVIQEEISETSVVLTWVPGFDNGSPQTFHIAYGKKSDYSSEWITKSVEHKYEAQMNYTLKSLNAETEYIASIYASNEEGSSPTINETFITLKHIPGEPPDKQLGLIGGSVAGGIAAVLVIIGVIIFVKKYRTSGYTKDREQLTESRRMNQLSSQPQDDEDIPDVVENAMYVPAGDIPKRKGKENRTKNIKAATDEDLYAQPNKNKPLKSLNSDIYAEVKKDKKKGTSKSGQKKQYDNKGFEDKTYENHDLPDKKKNVNKDGLIYADLEFANPPKGQKRLVIHGIDDMTVYAEVDLTKKADPLAESDDETPDKKDK